jgi:thioredoxin-dependent peroxiredoxin
MSETKLAGNPVKLEGEFPKTGDRAMAFSAVKHDLSDFSLDDYKGKRKILNIFPSIDTDVCATSVKTFNKQASELNNTVIFCLSLDLPFAHKRFCGTEDIENVTTGSLFRSYDFVENYGLMIKDSPLKGLMARAVLVLDENNKILHTELVDDITHEPDYGTALSILA